MKYKLRDDTEGENLLLSVNKAASAYQAWQSAAIGRAFDPYRLTSMLYNADVAVWTSTRTHPASMAE